MAQEACRQFSCWYVVRVAVCFECSNSRLLLGIGGSGGPCAIIYPIYCDGVHGYNLNYAIITSYATYY